MKWLLIVVLALAVAGLVMWFVGGRSPEVAADHDVAPRRGSDRFSGENQAPAGPDAEDQRVVARGVTTTGPSESVRDRR